MIKKLPQLPSIVWVFLFVFGLIAFIGTIIGVFFMLASVPGFASALFLIPGLIYVFAPEASVGHRNVDTLARAVGIGFFALMGMAVDQPGNFLYNYPLRYFCPEGTSINRTVDISHPLPGRTDLTQDFRCVDSSGKFATQIGMGKVIVVRFVEYVFLAYALIGLKTLRQSIKPSVTKQKE